jgi:hypothetical protein
MLAVTSYPKAYVDDCRARVDEQLATYRAVAASAKKAAVDAFEPVFFANLVLVLDEMFVDRALDREGEDGNPANEVRIVANSLLRHGGELMADQQIELDPATSVLGLVVGEVIRPTEADFVRLAEAFFAAIEERFPDPG